MIEFTPINGKTQTISTQKILETTPFSVISSSINEEFILQHPSFLCQETTITNTQTYFNNELLDTSEKSSTSKITLHSQENINNYTSTGEFSSKQSVLYYLSEEDLQKVYQQGFFNLQNELFSKTHFNPEIVDDKKYCLVKFINKDGRYIIQTEDNRFFMEPLIISNHLTSSSDWNLDSLLEQLIKNKQFLFIISLNGNNQIADLNNEKHLNSLITDTPYYNQNESNDQEEFSSVYIFNNDEIKTIIKNPTSWIQDLYSFKDEHLNDDELKGIFTQEPEKIIAFAANGFNFKIDYINKVNEKISTKPEKPVRKFRNN